MLGELELCGCKLVFRPQVVIISRTKQNNKNIVPTVTWKPWKPVVTKNDEPYTFSFHLKVTPYLYSIPWQIKNVNPKIIVTNKCFANFWCSEKVEAFKIEWWASVIVTPEVNSNNVLTKGNPHISNGCMLFGGQTQPSAIDGERLKWKNPQKNAKKNITSDTIKSAIP